MSIQTKVYTQKKTGKEIKKYFANVYNPVTKKSDVGPLRLKRAEAVADEHRLINEHALQKSDSSESQRAQFRKHLTVNALFEAWKPAACAKYASGTYNVYTNYYANYIDPVFGDRRVTDITGDALGKYISLLSEKYSAETVNKIINILSVMSAFSKKNYRVTLPLESIQRRKISHTAKVIWSPDQLQAFLKFSRTSHYYPMFLISTVCGCRPGEVCGIAAADYFPELHGISLSRGYNKYGDLTPMKTKGSHRWLPLPDQAIAAIDRHLAWKQRMQSSHNNFADNDFLFVSEFGAPITPDVYSHSFKRVLTRHNKEYPDAPLPDIPLYNFRHSFATNTLRGASPATLKDVAAIMGNSPRVMLERYAQIIQETNAAVVNNYLSDIYDAK